MINFLKFIYLILALLLNKELQIESETQIFENHYTYFSLVCRLRLQK